MSHDVPEFLPEGRIRCKDVKRHAVEALGRRTDGTDGVRLAIERGLPPRGSYGRGSYGGGDSYGGGGGRGSSSSNNLRAMAENCDTFDPRNMRTHPAAAVVT